MGYMNIRPWTLNPKSTLFRSTFSDKTRSSFARQDLITVQDKIWFCKTRSVLHSSTKACERRGRSVGTLLTGARDRELKKTKLPDVAKILRFRADFAGQRPWAMVLMGGD